MSVVSLALAAVLAGFTLSASTGFSLAAEKKLAKPAPSISLVERPTLTSEQFVQDSREKLDGISDKHAFHFVIGRNMGCR